MIRQLQNKDLGPYTFYYPDETIRLMGGDPNDYPQLEGHPGVRMVEANREEGA